MTTTVVATPEPDHSPPRIRLDLSAVKTDYVVGSLTLNRGGYPVRTELSALATQTVYDYDAPFDESSSYELDASYILDSWTANWDDTFPSGWISNWRPGGTIAGSSNNPWGLWTTTGAAVTSFEGDTAGNNGSSLNRSGSITRVTPANSNRFTIKGIVWPTANAGTQWPSFLRHTWYVQLYDDAAGKHYQTVDWQYYAGTGKVTVAVNGGSSQTWSYDSALGNGFRATVLPDSTLLEVLNSAGTVVSSTVLQVVLANDAAGLIHLLYADPNASSATPSYLPFTVASEIKIETHNTGSATESGTSATVALNPASAWLYHPYEPDAKSVQVESLTSPACSGLFITGASAQQLDRPSLASVLQPLGSTRGIAINLGPRRDAGWTLELATKNATDYQRVLDLFDDDVPLRFAYPPDMGRKLVYRWLGAPSASASEKIVDGSVEEVNAYTHPRLSSIYWGTSANSATVSHDPSGFGTLVTTPASGASDSGISLSGGSPTVNNGETWTYSVEITAVTDVNVCLSIQGGGGGRSNTVSISAGDVVRLSKTVTHTATAAPAFYVLRGDVNAYQWKVNRVMVEQSSTMGAYFDGDTADQLSCDEAWLIPQGWYSPGDLTETRDHPSWSSPLRRWSSPFAPVAAPAAPPE